MLPEERNVLQQVGYLVNDYLIDMAIGAIFTGATLGLGALVLLYLSQHGLRTWFKQFMFLSAIVVSLLSIAELSCYAAILSVLIRGASINLETNNSILHGMFPYDYSAAALRSIKLLIGDFIVLWRAWVLHTYQRSTMVLPYTSYAGSVVTLVAYLVLQSNFGLFVADASNVTANGIETNTDTLLDHFITAFTILSFATNVLSTLAIAARLYGTLRRVQLPSTKLMPNQKIILVLVESGVIFCSLQLVDLIMNFVPLTTAESYYAGIAIDSFFYGILPLFPLAVILLVNSKNTMFFSMGFSALGRGEADIEAGSQVSVPQQGRGTNTPDEAGVGGVDGEGVGQYNGSCSYATGATVAAVT